MPDYLGQQWFEHYVAEHERLGMTVWFGEWTGQGGWQEKMLGECERNPDLSGRRLCNHTFQVGSGSVAELTIPDGEVVLDASAYPLADDRLDGEGRVDMTGDLNGAHLDWKALPGSWLVSVVTTQLYDLNYLRPDVANLWLDMYFTPHLERLGPHVGKALRGYLQDELYVLRGNIIYDDVLLDRFQQEKGYDPRPYLTGLFHDIGPLTDKIRCEYYEVMSILLEESLYAPLGDWHEENGLLFSTIATWGRQDIMGQTGHYGDFFRICKYFHITGNEDPGSTEPGGRCFSDAKLSSSMLHLYDRERAAMCVYWGSGHGMTQEQNVAWTNENFTYGLNMYNTHGGLYGSLGSWYEWVPPSVHFRQPYFELWKAFVDYVSRVSVIMSQGRHVADVALLYPLTSIHANWISGNQFSSEAVDVNITTFALAKHIFTAGIDFDFINDDKLVEAEFRDGMLCLAQMEFSMVLLPPLTTVRTATLEKLRDYARAGGTVMAFRALPTASAERGGGDERLRDLLREIFGFAAHAEYSYTAQINRHAGISMSVHENEAGGKGIFVPEHEIHRTRYYDPGFERPACSVPEVISNHIDRDVVCSGPDVFHTHQKIGDLEAYFLFNVRTERRSLEFTFRVEGQPEIWNAHSGKISPCDRFSSGDGVTNVRLMMERNEGILLVFGGGEHRPEVREDDLKAVGAVAVDDDGLKVDGLSDRSGKHRVRVHHLGKDFRGEANVAEPPRPMGLGGRWGFELIPTMDNRWGDFRYPASPTKLGPEARIFRFRQEATGLPGEQEGWHAPDFDDANWQETDYSFGPYWHSLGPLAAEPSDQERIIAGDVDPSAGPWERYCYSQTVGHGNIEVYGISAGAHGLDENFLYFSATEERGFRFLLTWVCVDEAGEWEFTFGKGELGTSQFEAGWRYNLGGAGVGQQAWINGELVAEIVDGQPLVANRVHLNRGANPVVLKLIHEPGEPVSAIATITHPQDEVPAELPPPPRLRWFAGASTPVYDIRPYTNGAVGWYRFQAPSGTKRMQLTIDGDLQGAWVDGKAMTVAAGRIELDKAVDGVVQVALCIRQRPGRYAGAAIPEPVTFDCEPTHMALGDWSHQALEAYSGGAIYSIEFSLEASHLGCAIELDLGHVKVAGEVSVNGKTVGVGLARPFTFDLDGFCTVGTNHLQVRVYNTMANHYDVAFPSAYVFAGHTESGLLGPVEIRFYNRVRITALPLSI